MITLYEFTNVQSGDRVISADPDEREGEAGLWHRRPLVRVRIEARTRLEGIVGSYEVPVTEAPTEDDGSITLVIDAG